MLLFDKVITLQKFNKNRLCHPPLKKLKNEAGEEITYRIVGADELDPKKQYISLGSVLN